MMILKPDVVFGEIGNNHNFEVEVFNAGNVESEFRIFTSGNMRGWSVILLFEAGADCIDDAGDLLCTIKEKQSVNITAKVTPPGGDNAEIEDSFTLTFSAEPTEIGLVGRENVKLTVNGEPGESVVSSLVKSATTTTGLIVIGSLVVVGFGLLILRRRLV